MRLISLIFIAMTAGWSGFALAGTTDLDSLACGEHAIELGMSPADIKTTCGQLWKPAVISKHTRPAVGASKAENDHFEKWMYKTAGRAATHVIIKNDAVVRIFTVQ